MLQQLSGSPVAWGQPLGLEYKALVVPSRLPLAPVRLCPVKRHSGAQVGYSCSRAALEPSVLPPTHAVVSTLAAMVAPSRYRRDRAAEGYLLQVIPATSLWRRLGERLVSVHQTRRLASKSGLVTRHLLTRGLLAAPAVSRPISNHSSVH